MAPLPDPPIHAGADLRDFKWMPVDVTVLRDSSLATKSPEIFRASVLSWCVAWHQLPAGSLPACERELCYLLGFGTDLRRWKRLRDAGALHGWTLCSDGRLYHDTVIRKVVEALKQKESKASEAERLRKYRDQKRQGSENVHVREPYANRETSDERTHTETVRNSDGTGRPDKTVQDQNKTEEKTPVVPASEPALFPELELKLAGNGKAEAVAADEFTEWWKEYPPDRRAEKPRCAKLYAKIRAGGDGEAPVSHRGMMDSLAGWKSYWKADQTPSGMVPLSSTFLSKRRCDLPPPKPSGRGRPGELMAEFPGSESTKRNMIERHFKRPAQGGSET